MHCCAIDRHASMIETKGRLNVEDPNVERRERNQRMLDAIAHAAFHDHIAVTVVKEKGTGKEVSVLVAAVPASEVEDDENAEGTNYYLLARLFDSDPYAELDPPEGTELKRRTND